MKKILILVPLFALLSCATSYQQVASIASPELKLTDDGRFTYDVDDFVIDYNFWTSGGKVSFVLTNNSDQDVYVDLSRSFLVVNGMTFDYYQNRSWSSNSISTVTSSYSYGTSSTISSAVAVASAAGTAYSSGYSSDAYAAGSGSSIFNGRTSSSTVSNTTNTGVQIREKEGVWVPAHSSRGFCEFSLLNLPIRKCGLARNPSKKEEMTVSFTAQNTPYAFENMLMLVVGDKDCRIVNSFYIETLTNIRYDQSYVEVGETNCNNELTGNVLRFYKFNSPNRFFINYEMAKGMATDRVKKAKKTSEKDKSTANSNSQKKTIKSLFGKKENLDDGIY